MKFIDKLAKLVRDINALNASGHDTTEMRNGADMTGLTSEVVFQIAAVKPESARKPLSRLDLVSGKLEAYVKRSSITDCSERLRIIQNMKLIATGEWFEFSK